MDSRKESSGVIPVNPAAVGRLARAASRNQRGRVEPTGKRIKAWRGHYYIYERQADDAEKRRHIAVILGERARMTKAQAQDKLRDIIASAGASVADECTLAWFWRERFRPMKEQTWKESARSRMVGIIENYVVKPFGARPLSDITKLALQVHLNKMADTLSGSICQKFRVWTKAILDEAVEQDLIAKNPARNLKMPKTRKVCKRVLSPEEIAAIMDALFVRDRLIVRMFLVLGLRPGELFALRRNDYAPGRVRVDEGVSADGVLGDPKTEDSAAWVWLPERIEKELVFWLDVQADKSDTAFVFQNKARRPMNTSNFLSRVIKPACERVLAKMKAADEEIPTGFLEGVNHQAFRRTCATRMQEHGKVKDIQAHLRHSTPSTTMRVYVQHIPESVRAAVEGLDDAMFGAAATLKASGR